MPEKPLPKAMPELPISEKEVQDKASEKFPRPLIALIILGAFFVILSIIMTALVFYSYNKLASWGYGPTTFTRTTPSPTPNLEPTLKPLGTPPAGNIDFPAEPFLKKNYKLTDKIFDEIEYPNSLISKSDSELTGFKCTKDYYGTFSKEKLNKISDLNPIMKYLIEKAGRTHDVESAHTSFFCQTENNDQYLIYGILGDGGGGENTFYIAKVEANNELVILGTVPNPGVPYFNCNKILQIDQGDIYLQCGGGDGPGGAIYIYQINSDNKKLQEFFSCGIGPLDENNDTSQIKCSDGRKIIL